MKHPLENAFSSMSITEIIPPNLARIPVVDQALELANMMEAHNKSEEIACVLRAAARVMDLSTSHSFIVSHENI